MNDIGDHEITALFFFPVISFFLMLDLTDLTGGGDREDDAADYIWCKKNRENIINK